MIVASMCRPAFVESGHGDLFLSKPQVLCCIAVGQAHSQRPRVLPTSHFGAGFRCVHVQGLAVLPLCVIKRVESLGPASIVALVSMMFTVAVLVKHAITDTDPNSSEIPAFSFDLQVSRNT